METLNNLSIQPSFKCNWNCQFCYLGNLKADTTLLNLKVLKDNLYEIKQFYKINHVQVLGGEPSLLNCYYLEELQGLIKDYHVTYVTNLSNIEFVNFCLQHNVQMTISVNKERQHFAETVKNLKLIKGLKNIQLSSVVLPSLLNDDIKNILQFYNSFGFDVYFLKYNASKTNKLNYNITNEEYYKFIDELIKQYQVGCYNFKIKNIDFLLQDNINAVSCDSLFINPNGKFSTITYDDNNKEYFVEFDTVEQFNKFCESTNTKQKDTCKQCLYYKQCGSKNIYSSDQNKCINLFKIRNELL